MTYLGDVYFLRYLPATLTANDGKMTKTVAIKIFDNTSLSPEAVCVPVGMVTTMSIPTIPNTIDATIKIRVAIFCILLV